MSINDSDSTDLPESLMHDVHWKIEGGEYSSREDFLAAVQSLNTDIKGGEEWDPDQVVLRVPAIRVGFELFEGEELNEYEFKLESENGEFFTAGELLFSIHNTLVEELREAEHKFFVGLELGETDSLATVETFDMDGESNGDEPETSETDVPLYVLVTGS